MKKIFVTLAAALVGALSMTGVAAADQPTLKFCTGSATGNYEYTGQTLAAQLRGDVKVETVQTAGSWENLDKIKNGDCDGAVVQSDALYLYTQENVNAINVFTMDTLYTEYFHLLCNRSSGVEEFGDLNSKTLVFSGGRGSGADVTLRGLIRADKENGSDDYKDVPISNEGGTGALVKLSGGAAACLAYTGTPGAKFLSSDAEKFGENLVLVPVVDRHFDDVVYTDKNGKKISVWNKGELTYDSYNKIMPSGFTGRKNVSTMTVTAVVVVSDKWVNDNPDAFGAVGLAIPDVKKLVRSAKGLK